MVLDGLKWSRFYLIRDKSPGVFKREAMGLTSEHAELFDAFWKAYPHRVGKLAAQRAFGKALRNGATSDEILSGVKRYVRCKPEWQAWAHPTSWLNAGRWLDETNDETNKPAPLYGRECPHSPRCDSPGGFRCHQRTELDAAKAAR